MAVPLSGAELSALLCCAVPSCRAALELGDEIVCAACGERYRRLAHTLDLTPSRWRQELPRVATWERLQHNGLVSYTEAPEVNMAFGGRADCLTFSRFCRLTGLVLDVGCGTLPWLSYFSIHEEGTRFVGIDPLAADAPAGYARLRGLGEYLPFRDGGFDRVLFGCSLDHMLDPRGTLAEARRVCRAGGQVIVWSGEKKAGAPRPARSPEWYQSLTVPEGAEDPFHFKRFDDADVRGLLAAAGLELGEVEDHVVDAWRTNSFYRCVVGQRSTLAA
jgi:SAM-dependent methyltransferase